LALGKKKSLLLKMQQLILGTGTAIWWFTEPHSFIIDTKIVVIRQKPILPLFL
jgi:hypothetical protein